MPHDPMNETVRAVIDRAVLIPPAPEPFAADPPEPRRLRTDVIALLGIGAETTGESLERYGIGSTVCVYLDTCRRRRVLKGEQHSRIAIRSLFIGYEKTLTWLWPKAQPPRRLRPSPRSRGTDCRPGPRRMPLAQEGRADRRRG
jgi:hypothetical protein